MVEAGAWSRTLKRARVPIVSDKECERNVSIDIIMQTTTTTQCFLSCSITTTTFRTFHSFHSQLMEPNSVLVNYQIQGRELAR